MLENFGYIGLFLIAAAAFSIFLVVTPPLLRLLRLAPPNQPDEVKQATYECGMETVGPSWVQFNFRYYFFALMFVVFDIQVVFLYPWATYLGQTRLFGILEMAVFFAILIVGFVYAWRKKVLEWK
ncbi:MAG: NADH-quinone oxidoreductase subunit A [Chloroflexota bacterium]|nr:NADH-quinone oxidoreductase subunit A [Chloroflexota bacterium]